MRELGYFQFYHHIILQISGLSISNLLFIHGSGKESKLSFFYVFTRRFKAKKKQRSCLYLKKRLQLSNTGLCRQWYLLGLFLRNCGGLRAFLEYYFVKIYDFTKDFRITLYQNTACQNFFFILKVLDPFKKCV